MDILNLNSIFLLNVFMNMILSGVILLTLMPLKYSFRSSFIIIISVTLSTVVLLSGVLYYLEVSSLHLILRAVSAAILYICGYIISSAKGFRFQFIFMTVYILKRFGDFISNLFSIKFLSNPGFYIGFKSIIILIFIIIIINYIKDPFLNILNDIHENWGTFCVLPFIFNMAFYSFDTSLSNSVQDLLHLKISLLLFLLCFIIYYVIYLYFQDISYTLKLEKNAEMLELQKNYQKKEYLETISRLESLRIYRHDMRHHLNIIHSLISSGDTGTAKKYIDSLSKKFKI